MTRTPGRECAGVSLGSAWFNRPAASERHMAMRNDDAVLRDVLEEAALLPPERREPFLASACAENPEMRTRIESLLDELEQATEFLVDPTIEASSVAPPHETSAPAPPVHGQTIDRYHL